MGDAFEPFRAAAAGLPNSMSDAMPVARICADARRPGTVTTITAGDLRALAASARPGESRETSWPDAVPGALTAPAGEVLEALSREASAGMLAVSPQENDDWGLLRAMLPDADGYHRVVARANVLDDQAEQAAARTEDRQPRITRANADFIAALWNAYRSGRLVEAPSPTPARQEEGSRGDDGADDEQAFDDAVARMYAEQRARNTQIVGFVRKIPDGWVLVPREPTEAMLDAAVKGSAADVSYADVEELWPAMLSAAPHPSQEKGEADA